MSQENVEIVRRFLDLDVEEALAYADPAVVWNPVEEAPAEGHGAVRASLERWKGEWDDYELVAEDFTDLGDRVLATVIMRGRGRGSGVEVAARLFDLYTVREGKIVRMDQFSEESEALDVAGRSETTIEVFERAMAALNRQDLDAFLALMDSDVEGMPRLAAMEGVYHGHVGIRRWWSGLLDSFPDRELKVLEVQDRGGLTFARVRFTARGAGSGTPIDEEIWHLAWWRDGKCTRWGTYRSEAEALEAAGPT